MTNPNDEAAVISIYEQLLTQWNRRDARGFAALMEEEAEVIGFDGSMMSGRAQVESELARIFTDHPTASYVWKVRSVAFLTPDVAILRSVVGMVPPGKDEIEPKVNATQSIVAIRLVGAWRVRLLQNTPAAFHGRHEEVEKLTEELSRELRKRAS
jgi:uncharacterized protein (TIGR02246 family)